MSVINVNMENIRSINSAVFQIKGLTGFFGDNGEGKSTVMNMIAGALSDNSDIYQVMNRTNSGLSVKAMDKNWLLPSGATQGKISISGPGFEKNLTIPDGKIRNKGTLHLHPVATGVSDALVSTKQQRTEALTALFGSPTYEDLKNYIGTDTISEPAIKSWWDKIQQVGWDSAYETADGQCKNSKQEWRSLTKRNWGAKVGREYAPEGWTPILEGKSLDDLKNELETIRQNRIAEISEAAQVLKSYDDDTQFIQKIPELTKQIECIDEAGRNLDKEISEFILLKEENSNIPKLVKTSCPNCACALHIVDGDKLESDLTKLSTSKEEKQNPEGKPESQLIILKNQLENNRKEFGRVSQQLKQANEAQLRMDSDYSDVGKLKNLSESFDKQESIARQNITAKELKKNADTKHLNIMLYDVIKKALSPQGLRQEVLGERIEVFNRKIKELFPEEWDIRYDGSLNLLYKGREAQCASLSEIWRVNVVVSVTYAVLSNAPMVLVDGMDILTPRYRNELIKVLFSVSKTIPVALFMSRSGPKRAMDFSKGGAGVSYWVGDGMVVELNEKLKGM